MIQDYDGARVIDDSGDTIGTVERSYDDATGAVRYVEVKLGSLFGKHRLVPADDAEMTSDGLRLPFSKDAIMNSPDASSADDSISGDLLRSVRGYYDDVRQRIESRLDEVVAIPASAAGSNDDR
jgi:hypothetical protein